MRRYSGSQSGFTLIELLVAMALFSFLLLIVSSGFVGIVRFYQAGSAQRTVQQNSRFILDDFVAAARTAQDVTIVNRSVSAPGGGGNIEQDVACLSTTSGVVTYAVNTNSAGNQLRQGILPVGAACVYPSQGVLNGWRRVGDDNVYVGKFGLAKTDRVGAGDETVTITLSVASMYARDLVAYDSAIGDLKCQPSAGSHNCSVAQIISTVELRGGQ